MPILAAVGQYWMMRLGSVGVEGELVLVEPATGHRQAAVSRSGALAAARGIFALRLVAVRVAHLGTPAMWM
jgi:hypothetical protein